MHRHFAFGASLSVTGVADQAFVKMVAKVDKHFTTFSFKLAMLLFPVSLLHEHLLLVPACSEAI